jgi:hypothetical protein
MMYDISGDFSNCLTAIMQDTMLTIDVIER